MTSEEPVLIIWSVLQMRRKEEEMNATPDDHKRIQRARIRKKISMFFFVFSFACTLCTCIRIAQDVNDDSTMMKTSVKLKGSEITPSVPEFTFAVCGIIVFCVFGTDVELWKKRKKKGAAEAAFE